MFFGIIIMSILYLILRYVLAWINYFNSLDPDLVNQHGDGVMITT